MVLPQPETKYHAAAHSFPDPFFGGEENLEKN